MGEGVKHHMNYYSNKNGCWETTAKFHIIPIDGSDIEKCCIYTLYKRFYEGEIITITLDINIINLYIYN